jgi:hypothetical protein
MLEDNLKYQPVVKDDGMVAIHETIIDDEGNVRAATYEPVRLEANSIGELEALLRLVYRHMRKYKPITEDELEALVYSDVDCPINDEEGDEKVIDLVTYFADKYGKR